MGSNTKHVKGLMERLNAGEPVICAEGYLFEFEQRGYLKAGGFVPEIVLEHPELVRDLHREFVHAGSDVVLAFTYYAHREKMQLIGRADDLEKINRQALRIAREVADETGTLMAGNICNSTIYKAGDKKVLDKIREMFIEQVKWAVEGGADFIVAETFNALGEAMLALEIIKEHGKGLPAVVTLGFDKGSLHDEKDLGLQDESDLGSACRKLQDAGAAVVGLNCTRGPATMLPLLKPIKEACTVPIAALPVAYRTTEEVPVFQGLTDVDNHDKIAFPLDLDVHRCSRTQIYDFTAEAFKMGVLYLGLCCGNRSHYMRSMAEAVGKKPPASRYSPDMSLHYSRLKDDKHSFTQSTFAYRYKTN